MWHMHDMYYKRIVSKKQQYIKNSLQRRQTERTKQNNIVRLRQFYYLCGFKV